MRWDVRRVEAMKFFRTWWFNDSFRCSSRGVGELSVGERPKLKERERSDVFGKVLGKQRESYKNLLANPHLLTCHAALAR